MVRILRELRESNQIWIENLNGEEFNLSKVQERNEPKLWFDHQVIKHKETVC